MLILSYLFSVFNIWMKEFFGVVLLQIFPKQIYLIPITSI